MAMITVYICIISIFFFDWFYFVLGIGHRYITWIPEVVSVIAVAYIPAALALKKRWRLPPKYLLLILVYLIHIFTGFLLNSVSTGVMIAGSRQFFKFIPIFLIPSIIEFSERDIKRILTAFLICGFIQFPVTFWQRFVQYAHIKSGDPIGGTLGLNTSGVLSIFLLIVLTFLITFLLRNRISLKFFLVSFFVIFLPTTINETKIIFLLLPFAFLIPIYLGNIKISRNISRVGPLLYFFSIVFILFVVVYNSLSTHWDILDFFSRDGKVTQYTENTKLKPIADAFSQVYHDEAKTILFGYGAGNLSVSFSESMQSELVEQFEALKIDGLSITKMICEIGFLGAILFFLFLFIIFKDTLKSCRDISFFGTFSLCMSAYTVFLGISIFYLQLLNVNLLLYSFFFFSGYIVSNMRNARIVYAKREYPQNIRHPHLYNA